MESFQFYHEETKSKVTIDCSSYQRALFSLATLLQRDPDELLTTIYKIGHSLYGNYLHGVFEEVLAEHVIGKNPFYINVDKIYYFHFTRSCRPPTYEDGLLPLKASISKVWDNLFNIFKPIDEKLLKIFYV